MLFLHLVDIKGTLVLTKHGLKRLLLVLLLFFVLLVEIKGRLFLTRQGVKRVLFVDVVVSVFTIG